MSNCKPHCVSGTFHSDGGRIGEHIRKQHAAALRSAPDDIRSRRSAKEWRELYAAAMAEKRARHNGSDAELRKLWTAKGVPQDRQDAMIAEIEAKAQPGAKVGPFTIGE